MVLIDLTKLSQNQIVVADVFYSTAYKKEIINYNQIVLLTINEQEIRKGYFNRPEKRGFFEFVRQQEKADIYFENIFHRLELTNKLEQQMMKESGFLMLERN